jgi:prevent-host-death family protein
MHMHEVPVTEARAEFSELVSKVAYGGQPVVITRHGKPLVALVPAAYLEREPAESPDDPQRSGAPITVLDVTGRVGESSGPMTVAARQDNPQTR